ncbi:hypothetical protein [Acanthamoeba castellanii mimivirus]|uniref:Uncharacterized protein n=1 Tax=Acanthamoeba castellanii mimivirus TaxID=1899318 RepID=A0A1E1EWX4_9VIRU|nr:hypothetical protein m4_igs_660 [Acanthamoeba polyphaga mimivirus]BAV61782.1 hypothetical protein [Acanthamoeba castellanii mimivirus]BAV62768.1 hypothetical protein [Acanthamoeba castellanii mimivirus]
MWKPGFILAIVENCTLWVLFYATNIDMNSFDQCLQSYDY